MRLYPMTTAGANAGARPNSNDILKDPINWEDGDIIPPSAPGLGVELDEEVAAKHPYTGAPRHLQMVDVPVY